MVTTVKQHVTDYYLEVKPDKSFTFYNHYTYEAIKKGSNQIGTFGYTITWDGTEDIISIEFVYVEPQHRNDLKYVVNYIMEWCKKTKYNRAELVTIPKVARVLNKYWDTKPDLCIYKINIKGEQNGR